MQCFWTCFGCPYFRQSWTGCILVLIFKSPSWFFSRIEIGLVISSTALLQYRFYYKWCHFRQDRHKQTVSSELPIVIKLAIFQTIQSLSPSVTFQSPAVSKRGVYYLSCTSVHFQEKARIIVQIRHNYTWAPHCFWGAGEAHTQESGWHLVERCVWPYTQEGRHRKH